MSQSPGKPRRGLSSQGSQLESDPFGWLILIWNMNRRRPPKSIRWPKPYFLNWGFATITQQFPAYGTKQTATINQHICATTQEKAFACYVPFPGTFWQDQFNVSVAANRPHTNCASMAEIIIERGGWQQSGLSVPNCTVPYIPLTASIRKCSVWFGIARGCTVRGAQSGWQEGSM